MDPSPELTSASLTDEQHQQKMQRRQAVQRHRLAGMQDHKGLIIVNTGDGKGKSTAGFGIIFRALGHGFKVGVVQFIKGAWDPGEAKLLRSFSPAQVEFHAMGEGFTWETQDRQRDMAHVQAAWQKSVEMINGQVFQVILLDEINVALKLNYLSVDQVLQGLQQKPDDLHLILTGRGAPAALIERADLVTEMRVIKHPFREQGIKAQQGIEY
jgi:cob(I)alamin adenosyltransferase